MSKILPDSINTIASQSEFKMKEKGSLFHAISLPISNENEAQEILVKIRKQYFDATHHCYSYILHDGIFKYSDDGEPNGTAGIRIYNVQNHFDVTDILTVVIRYFGGTKLGVGPLGKAYYEAAHGSIQEKNILTKILYQQIEIEYDFSQSKNVHHFIAKYRVIIQQNTYDSGPKIICLIKPLDLEEFTSELLNVSNQQISIIRNQIFIYQTLNR